MFQQQQMGIKTDGFQNRKFWGLSKLAILVHISKQGSTPTVGRAVRETKSKNGHSKPPKPFISSFSVLGGGLRPWSQTMVSEGARPWGRVDLETVSTSNFWYRLGWFFGTQKGVKSDCFQSGKFWKFSKLAMLVHHPRVRKIRVRNSGAGNGCANFTDTWKNALNFCRKTSMSINSSFFQESPRQTKPKKGQFMNFSRGHSGTKVRCESRLFSQEKHQNSQKWAKFMNFSFWPFLWFGLPGRLPIFGGGGILGFFFGGGGEVPILLIMTSYGPSCIHPKSGMLCLVSSCLMSRYSFFMGAGIFLCNFGAPAISVHVWVFPNVVFVLQELDFPAGVELLKHWA